MKTNLILTAISSVIFSGFAVAQTAPSDFTVTQYNAKQQKDITAKVSVHVPAQPAAGKPAVILMTGCDASTSDGARELIKQLTTAGVLVAQLRSLEPWARGNSCNPGSKIMLGVERAEEAYRTRDEMVARGWASEDNVGIVGFSHGGWAVTHAAFGDTTSQYDTKYKKGFAAAVAFYPHCNSMNMGRLDLKAPTLILAGSADTWQPPATCQQIIDRAQNETRDDDMKAKITMKVFEGATHSWDNNKPVRTFETHKGETMMAYDPKATKESLDMTMQFFKSNLKFQ